MLLLEAHSLEYVLIHVYVNDGVTLLKVELGQNSEKISWCYLFIFVYFYRSPWDCLYQYYVPSENLYFMYTSLGREYEIMKQQPKRISITDA